MILGEAFDMDRRKDEPLVIRFQTLTPLWTGDVRRNSKVPRETGVIGSMRWWYEGIVRAAGGYACNPIKEDGCQFNPKDERPPQQQLCPACYLFGCTGWQRRFHLEVDGLEEHRVFFMASSEVFGASRNWLERIFGVEKIARDGRKSYSLVPIRSLWGNKARLRIIPLDDDGHGTLARLSFLLRTMARWGALGAKSQHGFGQVQIRSPLTLAKQGLELVECDTDTSDRRGNTSENAFHLDHFFSLHFRLPNSSRYYDCLQKIGKPQAGFNYIEHYFPCAFDIRYKSQSIDVNTNTGINFGLRPSLRDLWGRNVTDVLMGRSGQDVKDEQRSASRICVSHPFRHCEKWNLKIWGHVPDRLRDEDGNAISKDDVTDHITEYVKSLFGKCTLLERF